MSPFSGLTILCLGPFDPDSIDALGSQSGQIETEYRARLAFQPLQRVDLQFQLALHFAKAAPVKSWCCYTRRALFESFRGTKHIVHPYVPSWIRPRSDSSRLGRRRSMFSSPYHRRSPWPHLA
ncbi:hypothetical protein FJTKL_12020 [Diaporthe vaccinii]|uniref:Uncharacterized protein n=1 Tax=Diaporthe vaccinii TaxID=105482 RepID=A0ABR4FAX6_9PEZI